MFNIKISINRDLVEHYMNKAVNHYYECWGKDNGLTKKQCRQILEENTGLLKTCLDVVV